MKIFTAQVTSIVTLTMASLLALPVGAKDNETAPATYVNSDAKAYAAMQKLPADEPLHMLNMIRFKDKASYEDGSAFAVKGWTGQQAYAEYSRHSGPIANRAGGKVVYFGMPQLTLIGPEHEKWDAVFIVSYPNLASFLALVGDPEYKKHAFHRSAAVADSRLVRMASAPVPN
ncbi:DUF1330 domain-containing protein [Sphingorhabdus sp. Alg231-15]|uniref:DUF1330 domain-containing protein n=1 Tax=Sphingorhabdus sp. Alg231-15 TaxID=1922222 RepID=UPI000D55C70F